VPSSDRARRLLDIVGATSLLAVGAPLMMASATAVALSMGRPILFRQKRPGRGGRPFEILKFRTMLDTRDASGRPRPDAERLTRVGRFLRATSLDELPELWNVLCGDMALVGPRPLLMQYLERYSPRQARRHEVRPGLTGWAQVNGRNALSWDEKFELDIWYVDHRSLCLDIQILARTALVVLGRSGISHEGEATMAEFMGAASPGSSDRSRSSPGEPSRE
jgi:sugar transferase EpsL